MSASAAALITNDNLMSEQFWRERFPKLTIGTLLGSGNLVSDTPTDKICSVSAERVRIEGYFLEQESYLKQMTPVLGEAVKQLVAMELPPPFLFMFDEAWACFFRQHAMLAYLLGPTYRVLPDFWVWHVNPATEESGWKPHRDKGRQSLKPDGSPMSLTMWIPLSDALPINGCMYMVPADRDPVYNTPEEDKWQVNLPAVRALPALPGEYLCWNQAVLHWGGRASKYAPAARMSMALEFQRSDIQPFNQPLMDPFVNLPFATRLKLVAKQILQYKHMYALSPQLQSVAERIYTTT